MVLRPSEIHRQKNEVPYIIHTKMNSKWIKELNTRAKTQRHSGGSTDVQFHDPEVDTIPEPQTKKKLKIIKKKKTLNVKGYC